MAVGTAAVLGLLVLGIQSTSSADTRCIENPTVECVAEIATQSARALDRSTQWEQILTKLTAAGRPDVVEELAYRLAPVEVWQPKYSLEQIAISVRIAARARANPLQAVELDQLAALGDDASRISSTLYMVALILAGEQPYTRGGITWLVSAEAAYANKRRQACNSALQSVLLHWSEIVDAAPVSFPVYQRLHLADAYSLCRDREAARRILGKIDPEQLARKSDDLSLSQLARSWVRAGDLDRALAVASIQLDPASEVRKYLEVAAAYVSTGRGDEALKVVSDAGRALKKVNQWSRVMEFRASLIDMERRAGDGANALTHTEELAVLAEKPDPFRPFSLIRVATLFNDLNRQDRAIEILGKVIDGIPPSDQIVAFGHIAGPIRYDRSGLGGEAVGGAVVQLYRAGHKAKAIEVVRQADPFNRRRAAIEIVRDQLAKALVDPEIVADELKADNPRELLLVAAASRIESGDFEGAAEYFMRFAKGRVSHLSYHQAYVEVESVRVAVMLEKPEYATLAMQLGLRAAESTSDPKLRAMLLSSLAAGANARLP